MARKTGQESSSGRSPYPLRSSRGAVGGYYPRPYSNPRPRGNMGVAPHRLPMPVTYLTPSLRATNSSNPHLNSTSATPGGQVPLPFPDISGVPSWDYNNGDTSAQWANTSMRPRFQVTPQAPINSQNIGAIPRVRPRGEGQGEITETPVNNTFLVPPHFNRTSEMERHISDVRDRFVSDRTSDVASSSTVLSVASTLPSSLVGLQCSSSNPHLVLSGASILASSLSSPQFSQPDMSHITSTLPSSPQYSPPDFRPSSEFGRFCCGMGLDPSGVDDESSISSSEEMLTITELANRLPDHMAPLTSDLLSSAREAEMQLSDSTGTVSESVSVVNEESVVGSVTVPSIPVSIVPPSYQELIDLSSYPRSVTPIGEPGTADIYTTLLDQSELANRFSSAQNSPVFPVSTSYNCIGPAPSHLVSSSEIRFTPPVSLSVAASPIVVPFSVGDVLIESTVTTSTSRRASLNPFLPTSRVVPDSVRYTSMSSAGTTSTSYSYMPSGHSEFYSAYSMASMPTHDDTSTPGRAGFPYTAGLPAFMRRDIGLFPAGVPPQHHDAVGVQPQPNHIPSFGGDLQPSVSMGRPVNHLLPANIPVSSVYSQQYPPSAASSASYIDTGLPPPHMSPAADLVPSISAISTVLPPPSYPPPRYIPTAASHESPVSVPPAVVRSQGTITLDDRPTGISHQAHAPSSQPATHTSGDRLYTRAQMEQYAQELLRAREASSITSTAATARETSITTSQSSIPMQRVAFDLRSERPPQTDPAIPHIDYDRLAEALSRTLNIGGLMSSELPSRQNPPRAEDSRYSRRDRSEERFRDGSATRDRRTEDYSDDYRSGESFRSDGGGQVRGREGRRAGRGGHTRSFMDSFRSSAAPRSRIHLTEADVTVLTQQGISAAELQERESSTDGGVGILDLPSMPASQYVVNVSSDIVKLFKGDLEEYDEFKAAFLAYAQSIPIQQRLIMLKSKLEGDAKNLVSGCVGLDNGAFLKSFELLDRKFYKPELLIQNLVAQIEDYLDPGCRYSDTKFASMISNIRRCYSRIFAIDPRKVLALDGLLTKFNRCMPAKPYNDVGNLLQAELHSYTFGNVLDICERYVDFKHTQSISSRSVRDDSRNRLLPRGRDSKVSRGQGFDRKAQYVNAVSDQSLDTSTGETDLVVAAVGGHNTQKSSRSVSRGSRDRSRSNSRYVSASRGGAEGGAARFLPRVSYKCNLCQNNDHASVDCLAEFPNIDELVLDRKLCRLCLVPGHRSQSCPIISLFPDVKWRCTLSDCKNTPHCKKLCENKNRNI